ncbi:MAG: hypothetical protein HEQ39_16530 [Rhizobacter sp.]
MADVAQYYYATDLRPTGTFSTNNVKVSGSGWNDDKVTHQHMTTFVIGLGVSGTKTYDPNYKTATTGDFGALRAGTGNWPIWPDPTKITADPDSYHQPESIDDFWHTAVNGRGQYFNANDPDAVSQGLKDAFGTILGNVGAGTGSVLSDTVDKTDSGYGYVTEYHNGKWWGDLKALDNTGTQIWNAKSKLSGQIQPNCDNRNIYVRNPSGTNGLSEFAWNTVKCSSATPLNGLSGAQQALFDASLLSHYSTMDAAQKTAATGASLVNYLRGQTQNDSFLPGVTGKLYRKRDFALGDIINSRPAYVAEPNFGYADPGYIAFKAANAGRTGMVYVGANDGMLHAFFAPAQPTPPAVLPANAGQEAWAYIPSAVLPKMHKLADDNYNTNNELFVDGTPVIGDVQSGGVWRTILVGGLGAGGAGFYALDITNPTAPKSLWEFDSSDPTYGNDLGLSMGKPQIVKLASGQWVVMVTSGYNNSTGLGKLFILDAVSGSVVRVMDTGVGSASDPSGLTHLSVWVDFRETNFTAKRVYAGDLKGNVWRFDVNDNILPAGYEVTRIATLKDSAGIPQPITTMMELSNFNNRANIHVGTGKLLGLTDLTTTQTQSLYMLVDPLNADNPAYPDATPLRSVLKPLKTDSSYGIVCSAASCTGSFPKGWVIDFSLPGERVNVNPALLRRTLVVATNRPVGTASLCDSKFESVGYAVNPLDGSAIGFSGAPSGSAGKVLYTGGKATVGMSFIQPPISSLPGAGKGDQNVRVRSTAQDGTIEENSTNPLGGGVVVRRHTWRGTGM